MSFWVRVQCQTFVHATNSTHFQAYDTSKAMIYALTPNRTTKELTVAEYATAGFLSAIPTTLVTAPVERAKVLLQVGNTYYRGF